MDWAATAIDICGANAQSKIPSHNIQRLSPREIEVVKLIGAGLSNIQIAATLGISQKTVSAHCTSAKHKLQITHVAGLVRFAINEKLI